MAERTKSGVGEAISQGAAMVTESFTAGIFSRLREQLDDILEGIEERVTALQARMMRRALAGVLMLAGVLLIATAALLALVQYLRMSWPAALLIFGVLMLIGYWIVRSEGK